MNTIETLAAKYALETEEFDQTICTGRKNGVTMPETGKQLGAIGQNVLKLNNQCLDVAISMGYTKEDWNRARQFAIQIFESTNRRD